MMEYKELLYKTLYNLKKPIHYISDNAFYGYSYNDAISYIGKEKARVINKLHLEKMKRYLNVDLDSVGLYTVVSKKSRDNLYLLVNDGGYYIFDVDLIVLGTDPNLVKARIPIEQEWDILWEKLIMNENKINDFIEMPIKVSFTDEYGIYNEGVLYEFVEIMGCVVYGKVFSTDQNLYTLPLFFLDKL